LRRSDGNFIRWIKDQNKIIFSAMSIRGHKGLSHEAAEFIFIMTVSKRGCDGEIH
jgi:hypothetical protein